jgi:hypothetical protein
LQGGGLVAQDLADLLRCPDKELALFALAVGVLGAVKPSGRIKHFSHNVVQNLVGDGSEKLVAAHLPGMQVDAGQLGVAIQHLLKVVYAIYRPSHKV